MFFECSVEGLPPAARRWLAAGGSIRESRGGRAGLDRAAAAPAAAGAGPVRSPGSCSRSTSSCPSATCSSRGLGNIGDWAVVVRDLEPRSRGGPALSVVGALLYFRLAPSLLMPPLEPFLGAPAWSDRAVPGR